ncbi:histone-like protein [Paenibacillus peoriae]|uniref:histone-like protein n=1 Tax=Paenibacillus peoriae TaxID=59893 RepID=UPI00215B4926|nr:histone-like protein [Paenibacillus peoriae]
MVLNSDLIEDENDDFEGNEEGSGEIRVSRKGTLSRFVKSKIDGRISSEAKEVLMSQLEQLTLILIKRSEDLCQKNGRATIYSTDLEEAYEELMKPHIFIETVVDTLEKQKEELQLLANSSLVRYMEVD